MDTNLRLAQAGNPTAFERLLSPYLAGLYGFIRKRVGQMAEDVYQETLLAAWRALPGFKEDASLKTWLYAIAGYKCADALRRQSRQPRQEERQEDAAVPGFEEDSAQRLDVKAALSSLDQEGQDLLYLVYSEGFTQAEAARILGIPLGTIKSRLYHLRRHLKDRLEGERP
ncbi:MAG: RNA polymerase sigma factor [Clostridiales bacterium]|nr:RNA polymerase sigma factor [Clostridiales bacterium]